eukprot:1310756-Rhodomonas_salina.3
MRRTIIVSDRPTQAVKIVTNQSLTIKLPPRCQKAVKSADSMHLLRCAGKTHLTMMALLGYSAGVSTKQPWWYRTLCQCRALHKTRLDRYWRRVHLIRRPWRADTSHP